MHRAFSVFLFNDKGELLLQKRSKKKLLWPSFWTNSCCSHPRKGEDILDAANRRINEELGLTSELIYLFNFQYKANYFDIGSENEICSVLIGKIYFDPIPNLNEIEAWQYISVDKLTIELEKNSKYYTPWLKIEWPILKQNHWNLISSF